MPRKLAVMTYCTRSLRRMYTRVSGSAGHSAVYKPDTPVWSRSPKSPASIRVVSDVEYREMSHSVHIDRSQPDRILRPTYTGYSGLEWTQSIRQVSGRSPMSCTDRCHTRRESIETTRPDTPADIRWILRPLSLHFSDKLVPGLSTHCCI